MCRYCNLSTWQEVGQAWVASLLEPGEVEGVAEVEGCTGRQAELEHTVAELSYTVARLGEERSKVQGQLVTSEEQVLALLQKVQEQEQVMRVLRDEVRREQEDREEEIELEEKITKLEREGILKEGEMEELRRRLLVVEKEAEDVARKEREAREGLAEKEQEAEDLKKKVLGAEEEAELERKGREEVEEQLEEARLQARLLALQLEAGDQEVEGKVRMERSPGRELSLSMVHDTSVDDRLLSSAGKSVSHHLLLCSPRRPSAVSTPRRLRVSLIDELQEVEGRERSPLPCLAGPEAEPRARLARRLLDLGGGVEMVWGVQRAVEAFLLEQGAEQRDTTELGEEMFEEEGASLAAWHLDLDGMQLVAESRKQVPEQDQLALPCQQEVEAGSPGWSEAWKRLLLALVSLLVFTFCGLQLDSSYYYPATWHALRCRIFSNFFSYRISFTVFALQGGCWGSPRCCPCP